MVVTKDSYYSWLLGEHRILRRLYIYVNQHKVGFFLNKNVMTCFCDFPNSLTDCLIWCGLMQISTIKILFLAKITKLFFPVEVKSKMQMQVTNLLVHKTTAK